MLKLVATRFITQTSQLTRTVPLISVRLTHGIAAEERFKASLKNINKLSQEPDDDTKLKLYGLFKQVTVGRCDQPEPSRIKFVERAKWQAWHGLESMSKLQAMNQYSDTVEKLLKEAGVPFETNPQESSEPIQQSAKVEAKAAEEPGLLYTKENKVAWLRYNRPKKYNSITTEMYDLFVSSLEDAAKDDDIKIAVITGNGPYYSSGNDLGIFSVTAMYLFQFYFLDISMLKVRSL